MYLRETTLGKNSYLLSYMSSKMGSTLKGKNLLLRSKFFSLKSCPHCKCVCVGGGGGGGAKQKMASLLCLKVYPFSLT